MPAPYRVGILTVSDTSFLDPSTDRTGPILCELFNDASLWSVSAQEVVPDEVSQIQAKLLSWSASGINFAVTTGGTGFAIRDVTPEAVRPLLAKEATGLQQLMMSVSLQKTPMAALARPVAGVTHDGMIIITVPGSPKGAKENVEALLALLPHALDLASGGSGKAVHRSMGMPERHLAGEQAVASTSNSHSHSHSHHHHHHHHHSHGHNAPVPRSMDVSKGASARQRQSPYPIIPLEEAFESISTNTHVLDVVELPVDESLLGYILAEDVYCESDLPSTITTNVDGYAVRAAETPEGVYPVLTSSNYSSDPSTSILSSTLPQGHIYRINTGAPLPLGADAVVMVEDTGLVSTHDDNSKEEREVRLLAAVPKGENIRLPGSDVKAGEKVLEKGTRISEVGGEIGTLAFVGRKRVKVFRKPKVAIMSTGNEITDLNAPAAKSDLPVIHDSNRPSLNTAIRSHGFAVQDLGIIPDEESAHIAALQKGMAEADVIVTTGGTSMGESDLLKPVIERNLHGTIHFGRVAMKPGKPTTFASIPGGGAGGNGKATLIFALPGNPASALVTFHLFVLPCLRKMSGFASSEWHLPKMKVSIDTSMRLDPRPEFHRVWISPSSKPPYLTAKSTGGQRSSRTVSLAGANGLVCLPSSKESDKKEVGRGEIVDAILIGRLG